MEVPEQGSLGIVQKCVKSELLRRVNSLKESPG